MRVNWLTFVACTPRLISIIAGDSQYSLLYGCAVDVLNWAGGLEVLFDGLVHHQVLELPELRADIRKPSGAHVGRLAHPAGKREQGFGGVTRQSEVAWQRERQPVNLVYDWIWYDSSLAKPGKSVLYVPQRQALRAPAAPLLYSTEIIILQWPCIRTTTVRKTLSESDWSCNCSILCTLQLLLQA